MLAFSQWLAATPLSEAVQNILWLIPAVQTVHILSLAILLTSVGAVALASFGRLGRAVALADMAGRFAPWVWGAFAILLASGTILIIGEPVRELINWAFWIKVPLLVVAAGLTAVFLSRLARGRGPVDPARHAAARGPALGLVLLWCLVIVFGRLIAYAQITLG
jgi:hypothetical protein